MGPGEPPPVPRLRLLARVMVEYAFALMVLLQVFAVLGGSVPGSDLWVAIVPSLWFDIAVLGLLAFLWGLSFGGPPFGVARGGLRAWLLPDFHAIRAALRSPSLRSWVVGAGIGYAILLLFLIGAITVGPAGTAPPGPSGYPFFEVFEGAAGWGWRIVWAPNPYFAVQVWPFTLAAVALLSLLAGVGIGLAGHLLTNARASPVRTRTAVGASAGLLEIGRAHV